MTTIDLCIAALYRLAAKGENHYRQRALMQVNQLIQFDGALWGTGRLDSTEFHSVDVLAVHKNYPKDLARTKQINPFFNALKAAPAEVQDMARILTDDEFYNSPVYHGFFSRYGVERLIGILLPDETTGMFNLISLYRFDRAHVFSLADQRHLKRISFHLVSAASHFYFLHLTHRSYRNEQAALAICDKYGLFIEVESQFVALIRQYYPAHRGLCLPFNINTAGVVESGLFVETHAVDDLYCVAIWQTRPIDLLSEREREVVHWVTKGLSFKQVAKEMGLAASTVSNHLYNIYRKLNIVSRAELARLLTQ